MECDSCHKDKPDVELVVDPYVEDVHNEKVERYLCDECYKDRIDGI